MNEPEYQNYEFYGTQPEQTPRQEPAAPAEPWQPPQRRSTPMAGPKHPRRRGCLVVFLVVAVLAMAAVGIVRLVRSTDFSLERTENGISFAVGPKGTLEESMPSDAPAQEAETPLPAPPRGETPQQPEAPEAAAPQATLDLQPGKPGAENASADDPAALSLQAIYEKMIPSVVSISTSLQNGSATGTGIIMSADGYIITNHHVISGAYAVNVLTSADQMYSATLVGSDEASDLAVLKVEADGPLTAAEFGDSDALRVGDMVVAIGDPLGIQLRGTMTDGIISAINRDMTVNDRKMTLIQTNAALNNGNSGGPLINCYGQVVGVNTMKMGAYYSGASVEGLGFAIPMSIAKPIVDELIENGYVAGRPALGISGEQLPRAVRAYYGLPDGVYLTYINPISDAWAKGLQEGDIITAINDSPVSTTDDLNKVKNEFSAGETVNLTVFRGGKYYSVDIVLMDQALQ